MINRAYMGRLNCHKTGNTLVGTKPVAVYASGVAHGVVALTKGVHINLGPQENGLGSGYAVTPGNILGLPKPSDMRNEILVNWPDFGSPQCGTKFWQILAERIKARHMPILVYCFGGHGRTGTALSILYGLWGQSDPISHIRKVYCNEAVESPEQIDYIVQTLSACGIEVPWRNAAKYDREDDYFGWGGKSADNDHYTYSQGADGKWVGKRVTEPITSDVGSRMKRMPADKFTRVDKFKSKWGEYMAKNEAANK